MTDISVNQLRDTTVYDREGAKIGKVEQIFLDPKTEKPNFITVKTGASSDESVIPVASARIDDDTLRVPFDKETIANAPSVDTDDGLEASDQDEVVQYYESSDTGEKARPAEDTGEDEDTEGDVEEKSSMIRYAERLDVGAEWEETGQTRLRKRVVTRTETVEVPLQREELVIEREPLSDEDAQEDGDLSEDEEVIVLREERAVVNKEVVGVEKVTVGKRTMSETETVSADVQEEQIDIDEGTENDDRR